VLCAAIMIASDGAGGGVTVSSELQPELVHS
jgi:hypothetical protein